MIEKSFPAWLAGLALVVAPHVALAAAQDRPEPTASEIHAVRLDASSIRLDGVPDEAVWQEAAVVHGLTSYDPVDGQAPAGQMTAWIFYDANAVYIAARIGLPLGAMGLRQPWLFTEHDTKLESHRHGSCIPTQSRRLKHESPTEQHDEDSHVHGISAESIKTDGHQTLRRCPWSEGSLAGGVEGVHAPKQHKHTDREDGYAKDIELKRQL